MQDLIIEIVDAYGYLGVCFLLVLENVFPPIPAEVILTFGGFMTTCTDMTVFGTIAFATIGSAIGALILYWVGVNLTPERLGRVLESKIFRRLGFGRKDIEKTMSWFKKYGNKAILFGRCVPIVRSLVSIPAGMTEIKMPLFLLYRVIGSTIWNTLLVCLGAVLGASWEAVLYYLEQYSHLVLLGLGGIAVVLIFLHRRKKRR